MQETFKFWDLVRFILEVLRYSHFITGSWVSPSVCGIYRRATTCPQTVFLHMIAVNAWRSNRVPPTCTVCNHLKSKGVDQNQLLLYIWRAPKLICVVRIFCRWNQHSHSVATTRSLISNTNHVADPSSCTHHLESTTSWKLIWELTKHKVAPHLTNGGLR